MLTDCKSVRTFAAGRTFLAALGNRIFAESLEQDITKKNDCGTHGVAVASQPLIL